MAVSEIDRLIELLARLPGLGPRSARRAVLHLIKKREALLLSSPRRSPRRPRTSAAAACANAGGS
jgi:recombination protein RecR